jgi:murein DD-endopeptidase MepM/ murein hydrolase activator NlpD
MSTDVNSITNPSSSPAEPSAADRAQIKALAQQFEAMLMTQMLREMRKSMIGEEEDEPQGLGADTMTDNADIELGLALSRGGGLGLTDALLGAFERQIDATKTGASERAIVASPAVTGRPGAVLEGITSPAPVSSDFGWRRDPITGESRFHQGVDIAVAYGHDVKSAADGVVAFAGVQNGYGNTVVVNHDGGRQTRYAHLSEQLVRVGEVVTEGQLVGRSGNSGRSTGPHLHFEMLVGGQPVDPAE